ncbi:histone deacetylase family protein [Gallionella capsiferriformans]|uniref:Histone deacetylase superfamily n=1 Tax=Gallionella capsiferriformans (strain ES-2) TaxID=395494 RepID=D9SFV9_GALCS|nr:histone deacetylase family protein [Gallionella capsiferriformans]ADL55406.1 histone deacetylase superfamily [Gallionella capsiferriformans ES-2]
MQTAYLTHPVCLKHDMGAEHPECPARIHAIEDQLIASGLFHYLAHFDAPKVTREQLLRVHQASYVDSVFERAPETGRVELDGDTLMNPYTLDAALHAAGAAVRAVDLVMSGQAENAFCNIRPPGHHAGPASAAGFCIFNNVAIAAAHALEQHGLQRVAIVDFDVHHGDGTEAIFRNEPRVMLCSTFRHPYYPYCGADSSNSHIINVPLAAGSSGVDFQAAVTQHWLPALAAFSPQLLIISAGFDAHREDDMGGLALREADYAWVTGQLKTLAEQHAAQRIVSVLEGGYSLSALGRSVTAHIRELSGL